MKWFYVSWKVKVKLKWIEGDLILLWLFGEMKKSITSVKIFSWFIILLEHTSQRYYPASRVRKVCSIITEYYPVNGAHSVMTLLCGCKQRVYIFLEFIAEILSCEWYSQCYISVMSLLFACKKGVDNLSTHWLNIITKVLLCKLDAYILLEHQLQEYILWMVKCHCNTAAFRV